MMITLEIVALLIVAVVLALASAAGIGWMFARMAAADEVAARQSRIEQLQSELGQARLGPLLARMDYEISANAEAPLLEQLAREVEHARNHA